MNSIILEIQAYDFDFIIKIPSYSLKQTNINEED
jgi:hypothetical protein